MAMSDHARVQLIEDDSMCEDYDREHGRYGREHMMSLHRVPAIGEVVAASVKDPDGVRLARFKVRSVALTDLSVTDADDACCIVYRVRMGQRQ
jgi:hypothetical protein